MIKLTLYNTEPYLLKPGKFNITLHYLEDSYYVFDTNIFTDMDHLYEDLSYNLDKCDPADPAIPSWIAYQKGSTFMQINPQTVDQVYDQCLHQKETTSVKSKNKTNFEKSMRQDLCRVCLSLVVSDHFINKSTQFDVVIYNTAPYQFKQIIFLNYAYQNFLKIHQNQKFEYYLDEKIFVDLDTKDTLTYLADYLLGGTRQALPPFISFDPLISLLSINPKSQFEPSSLLQNENVAVHLSDGSTKQLDRNISEYVLVVEASDTKLAMSDELHVFVYNTEPYLNKPIYSNAAQANVYYVHVGSDMQFVFDSNVFLDDDPYDALTFQLSSSNADWLNFDSSSRLIYGSPSLSDLFADCPDSGQLLNHVNAQGKTVNISLCRYQITLTASDINRKVSGTMKIQVRNQWPRAVE